jgi:hypothetical protein
MDNGIIYARDVSNGLITQLKSVDNMLLLYNIVGGCYDCYINGVNFAGNTSFNVPVAGSYILNVCASAYSSNVANLQIDIHINGGFTNKSLKKYTNELNSHKVMVPLSFKYNLNQGANTISFKVGAYTVVDAGDFASFNWVYAPS